MASIVVSSLCLLCSGTLVGIGVGPPELTTDSLNVLSTNTAEITTRKYLHKSTLPKRLDKNFTSKGLFSSLKFQT